jgi:cytochrome P450
MNAIVDLNDARFRANPYPTYAMLRNQHPVYRIEPEGILAISRHQQVKAALRDHHTFSSRGFQLLLTPDWFPDEVRAISMLAKDPPAHTRLRSLINKAFTPSVIQQMEAGMVQVADELIGGFVGAPSVELLSEFSYPYISRIIGRIIGFEPEVYPQIKQWLDLMAQIRPTPPSPSVQRKIRASQDSMIARSRRLIAERRRQPQADLVSHFVHAEVDGEMLSETECVSMLNLLIGAGFDTTVNLLSNCIRQLSAMPELLPLLYRSPQRIEAFVDEVLRFDPPTHALLRQVTRDIAVDGVDIAAGSNVFLLIGSACRDAEVFSDPDTFVMDRRQNADSLAFGFGAHACIGRLLARLEVKVAVHAFVNAFNKLQCPSPDALQWKAHLVSRGLHALPVTLSARQERGEEGC